MAHDTGAQVLNHRSARKLYVSKPTYFIVSRLFDSPHTPKTLRDKCSTPSHHPPRTKLFPPKQNAQTECLPGVPSASSHHLHPPSDEDSALGSLPPDEHDESRFLRPVANINPFTPDGKLLVRHSHLCLRVMLSPLPTQYHSLNKHSETYFF